MMLLSYPPHKVRQHLAAEAEKNNTKRSSMLDWSEPIDQDSKPDSVTEREGRCIMNRLKLFAHVFL